MRFCARLGSGRPVTTPAGKVVRHTYLVPAPAPRLRHVPTQAASIGQQFEADLERHILNLQEVCGGGASALHTACDTLSLPLLLVVVPWYAFGCGLLVAGVRLCGPRSPESVGFVRGVVYVAPFLVE
jgi:hypothetical protein